MESLITISIRYLSLDNGSRLTKMVLFDEEGKCLKNTTFDGYAFDHEGVMGTNQWMTIQGELLRY